MQPELTWSYPQLFGLFRYPSGQQCRTSSTRYRGLLQRCLFISLSQLLASLFFPSRTLPRSHCRFGDRWKPFDSSRNWPDLGERFIQGERAARKALRDAARNATRDSASGSPSSEPHAGSTLQENDDDDATWEDRIENDKLDLDWATVLKRTFESYIRGERPNMYGEWIVW